MRCLDTNVLVRYLTEDDENQSRRAARYISNTAARGDRCFISPVVMCEVVWVLRDAYQYSKAEVVDALDRILATVQFEVGSKDLVRRALDRYRIGSADFADYLIGMMGEHAGCEETATFDHRLRSAPGFRVL